MSSFSNYEFAIVTINDDTNYGNRLQNYALSTILSQSGRSITVNLNFDSVSSIGIIKYFLNPVKNVIKDMLIHFSSYDDALKMRRIVNGNKFTEKFVPSDCLYFTHFARAKSVARFVIGSDQVWNYRWLSKETLALRLGSFVPDEIPIISYAASFGVSEIDDDIKPIFQKYLPRLRAISVREDRGAELVKEMTGLNATVVLDPTLMLTANQWTSITRGFVPVDEQYVLTYFLGHPSEVQEQAIQNYAREHGCTVRRILDLRDKKTYVAGPQDFVELFSKAEYVFTDSYHACCFSVLFHKQFTVFNRAGTAGKTNMNSRMETLFRLLGLDSVVMDEGLAPRIDYQKVDALLEQHRTESRAWLDQAMEA